MLNLLIRTLIIYVAVITVMRLMGKRQIGELQPFEMVITIIIADLAAIPMQDEDYPLIRGILPLAVLLFAQVVLSFAAYKSKRFRNIINGTPSILIANGKINHKELQKSMINYSDLIESMHKDSISDIREIDLAVLETDGNINIFQKPRYQCATKEDLKVNTSKDQFSYPIIINGCFLDNYLQYAPCEKKDVEKSLKKDKHVINDVLFGYLDSAGKMQFLYKRDC